MTFATLEEIWCNTTAHGNVTAVSKISVGLANPAPSSPKDKWLQVVQVGGQWTELTSGSAQGGSYLAYHSANPSALIDKLDPDHPMAPGMGWVTFGFNQSWFSHLGRLRLLTPHTRARARMHKHTCTLDNDNKH